MSASNHFNEIAGIIGGVGPEATNYFVALLVALRGKLAKKDQDHIPFLLFNNPQIPDRTKHLAYKKEDPSVEFIHTGHILKQAGATFLVIPCNAAHAYIEKIAQHVQLPFLNMIELTVEYIVRNYGSKITVGLLATDGTIVSNIYQNEFAKVSSQVKLMLPNPQSQRNIMEAIYDIKSHGVTEMNTRVLYNEAKILTDKGASIIILGCTEIPLALKQEICSFSLIDPMMLLAEKVIEKTLIHKVIPQSSFPLMVLPRPYGVSPK